MMLVALKISGVEKSRKKTERPVSVKCQHVKGTDTLMLNYMFYKRKE